VLGQQPRESKLVQDLLAALIYLTATFAIIADVFDLPVKGLLATSGALAIIIGLALQSSLGDVFSGIVLISSALTAWATGHSDDTVQGKVIETNWRATHILTGNQDVAIIPNSVIAKTKLVNCSTPDQDPRRQHPGQIGALADPRRGCNLLKECFSAARTSCARLNRPSPSRT